MAYAIVAERPGETDVLRQVSIVPPIPKRGEVLIRQTAIGVNYIDIYFRRGIYPWSVENDLILGSEGVGVVEAIGAEVSGFRAGDRVAYAVPNGGYATHRVVPANMLLPLPDDIDDATAAATILKGLTAYYLIHNSFKVAPGHKVLFHAAAGGVGLIAGQWLAAMGVEAIGTAGTSAKCKKALRHGFTKCINYTNHDFVERVDKLTDGKGVSVVYDSVGKDTLLDSAKCLEPFGTLVSFGQSSGAPEDFRVASLSRASLYLQRPTLFQYCAVEGWLQEASEALFGMISSGQIKMAAAKTHPLEAAAEVHDLLEARKTTGATVLVP